MTGYSDSILNNTCVCTCFLLCRYNSNRRI